MSVLDTLRVEGIAALPHSVDGNAVAGTDTPDVDRPVGIDVAHVDLHEATVPVLTNREVPEVAVAVLHHARHPAVYALRHSDVIRVIGVVGLARRGHQGNVDA